MDTEVVSSRWSISAIITLVNLLVFVISSPVGWVAHRYWVSRGELSAHTPYTGSFSMIDQEQARPVPVMSRMLGPKVAEGWEICLI
jgi:hypothetical protein